MNIPRDKLTRVAEEIAADKPELHFFGLVHRAEAPDRWDLLVSSDQLVPWSMKALNFVVEHLKKILTTEEMVQIAQVVALPRDNKIIQSLKRNPRAWHGSLNDARPRIDEAVVIWPMKESREVIRSRA